jgi:hypothetical protein
MRVAVTGLLCMALSCMALSWRRNSCGIFAAKPLQVTCTIAIVFAHGNKARECAT